MKYILQVDFYKKTHKTLPLILYEQDYGATIEFRTNLNEEQVEMFSLTSSTGIQAKVLVKTPSGKRIIVPAEASTRHVYIAGITPQMTTEIGNYIYQLRIEGVGFIYSSPELNYEVRSLVVEGGLADPISDMFAVEELYVGDDAYVYVTQDETYEKTTWVPFQTIVSASRMNKIEEELFKLNEVKASKNHTHMEYATQEDVLESLSNLATKEEVAGKASSSDLIAHTSDSVVHITAIERNRWNSKSDFSGSYNDLQDKPNIDVDKSYVDEELSKKANISDLDDLHTHSNLNILEAITSEKISSWDSKSNFSGDYNDLSNKPYVPSKVSDLTNDSGFITINHNHDNLYYHKDVVDQKIADAVTSGTIDLSSYLTKVEAQGEYSTITMTNNKVDKIDGKGLSTNDYTNVDKNKLNGIENGANNYTLPTSSSTVLGGVKIGSNISISNGVISTHAPYTHPSTHEASMITQTSTYRFVSDTEKNTWNNKSDFNGDYDSLMNKPFIPVVDVTKSYVDEELNKKANVTDIHFHTNKYIIDSITSEQVNFWDNKSEFSGNYNDLTNKPNIDVNKAYVDNALSFKLDKIDAHEHENKLMLDIIDGEKITFWDNKSEFSGSYDELSGTPYIPMLVSDLTNDMGYVTINHNHNTLYYQKSEVDQKIADAVTGGTVDLSGYLTKVEAQGEYATISTLNNKVDKVTGKGLSTNDYTNAEKDKLNSINISDKVVLSNGSKNFVIGVGNDGALTTEETSENPTVIIGCNPVVTNTLDGSIIKFWKGTQAQYDAISEKDSATFYIVIG